MSCRRRFLGLLTVAALGAGLWSQGSSSAAPAPDVSPAGDSQGIEATGSAGEQGTDQADFQQGEPVVTDRGWFLHERSAPLPPLPETLEKAFVIPVREPISEKTFRAMSRKADRALADGAELIIIDMDTWGGEVIAALDISRMLKTRLENVRTVCLVNTRAVSAGALIALACDEIFITPVGKIGDAAPVSMGGRLEGVEREKLETVLRNEFGESSDLHGYPRALAQCMVSASLECWLIRNRVTRELRYVLAENWAGRLEKAPAGQTSTAPTTAPAEDDEPWEFLEVIVPEGRLLTLTPREALNYGFVVDIVQAPPEEPYADLAERYNIAGRPEVMEDLWSETLVGFLTSPAITGLLFFLAIFFAYMEINSPGFGVAGALAIICFTIVFGSRYLTGLALWWEIALFVVGVALVLLEVFVIPGFGVAGILGGLSILVSLVAIAIVNAPDEWPIPQTSFDWSRLVNTMLAMMMGFIAAAVAGASLSKYVSRIPGARRLVLQPAEPGGETPAVAETSPIHAIRPGDHGITVTPCRPVGRVRINEVLVDAISDGEMIPTGEAVRVLRREGNTIIIERL